MSNINNLEYSRSRQKVGYKYQIYHLTWEIWFLRSCAWKIEHSLTGVMAKNQSKIRATIWLKWVQLRSLCLGSSSHNYPNGQLVPQYQSQNLFNPPSHTILKIFKVKNFCIKSKQLTPAITLIQWWSFLSLSSERRRPNLSKFHFYKKIF